MAKQKQIGKNNYIVSEDARVIAEKVIKEETILNNVNDVKVEYILVDPCVNKFTAARCYKTNKHTKFFSDFDYIVELSNELWDKLNEETKKILMLHELMHIKVSYNKKAEIQLGIKDHDIQDFSYIVKKYGIDWISNIKTEFASVYDLEFEDEKKITL